MFLFSQTPKTSNKKRLNPKMNEEKKEEDLFGGQGAVAVEFVHECERVVVFQCSSLLLFVFDFHSNHDLHFLEGSVHLFHRFLTLSRENAETKSRISFGSVIISNEQLLRTLTCFDFQKFVTEF